jgi:hypothetical protein
VPGAVYFPFSRCLDDVALKQAVLLYDEIVFLDPVSEDERAWLYEGGHNGIAGSAPRLAHAWRDVRGHYELLAEAGLVRFVDPTSVLEPALVSLVIDWGLEVDVRSGKTADLFAGKGTWSLLEQRLPERPLPPTAHLLVGIPDTTHMSARTAREIRYDVGSSVSLTYAMAACHGLGGTLMTDSADHHRMLVRRLQAAAGEEPGLRPPEPDPLKRRLIELRVVEELAPARLLAELPFEDVLRYRHQFAESRAELAAWIDRLVDEAHGRASDSGFEAELQRISARAREVAAAPGRWGAAVAATREAVTPGGLAATATAALTATIVPGVSTYAGLLVGGGLPFVQRIGDALLRRGTPERNAVSYLLNADRTISRGRERAVPPSR